MKKNYLFMFLALAIWSFCCFSLPNPSDKKHSMIYAYAEYRREETNPSTKEVSIVRQLGHITVKIKNIATGKRYSFTSDKNGELIKVGLPDGAYEITKATIDIYYKGSELVRNLYFDKIYNGRFKVRQGVTNLGTIRIEENTAIDKRIIYFNYEPEVSRNNFRIHHFESLWNSESWFTMEESIDF